MQQIILALALAGAAAVPAYSQINVPAVSFQNDAARTTAITPNEAAFHMEVFKVRESGGIPESAMDSLNGIMSSAAKQWIRRIASNTISGIQLDSYGRIRVIEGQEAQAQSVIDKRLLTAGLTPADKAYTYLTAIEAFADVNTPERLQVAKRYLASLDVMGDVAAAAQFRAHRMFAGIYYAQGQKVDVLKHGMHAVALLNRMEFPDRKTVYRDPRFYSELVDVLAGESNAQERIKFLNESLLQATNPSADMVRMDSSFYFAGDTYKALLKEMITVGVRLGTRAQDVVGNYWLNLSKPGAVDGPQTLSVSDGKIHVLEMGHYTCPQCRTAMAMLQKLQDRFQNIRVVTATTTQGAWSNRNVKPEVEAEHLREFYVNKLGIRYPISIWKGELKPTDDGGMLPENYGPNFENYPLADKPNIYVIDGKGIIRRVFVGGMTPEREAQLIKIIEFLQKEQNQ